MKPAYVCIISSRPELTYPRTNSARIAALIRAIGEGRWQACYCGPVVECAPTQRPGVDYSRDHVPRPRSNVSQKLNFWGSSPCFPASYKQSPTTPFNLSYLTLGFISLKFLGLQWHVANFSIPFQDIFTSTRDSMASTTPGSQELSIALNLILGSLTPSYIRDKYN
ncbi:hypothetical protein K469DRAFT_289070 [Zopfia rhizophila CBS 207.26]|uniref:Uncharacterized protein n=1 Tax=Zopfia rhizophila CBS 207.26 TaxID=1314779 RepID=A0A6A6ERG3_9PEZI|nr:hypothetical protein K469DRAFT_289070 [Zopfia rhizophila CBS 207.26]